MTLTADLIYISQVFPAWEILGSSVWSLTYFLQINWEHG